MKTLNTFTAYEVRKRQKYQFGDEPNPFVLFAREAKKHGDSAKVIEEPGGHCATILWTAYVPKTPEEAHAATTARYKAAIKRMEKELADAKAELASLPPLGELEVIETKLPTQPPPSAHEGKGI